MSNKEILSVFELLISAENEAIKLAEQSPECKITDACLDYIRRAKDANNEQLQKIIDEMESIDLIFNEYKFSLSQNKGETPALLSILPAHQEKGGITFIPHDRMDYKIWEGFDFDPIFNDVIPPKATPNGVYDV